MDNKQLTQFLCASFLSLSLAACGGGGGGAAGNGSGVVNEGTYSPSAFGYQSPNGPGFHPLGTSSIVLEPLSEVALFAPSSTGTPGRILDDATAGSGQVAAASDFLEPGEVMLDSTSGNVDEDGNDELVFVTRIGNGPVTIRTVKVIAGVYQSVGSFTTVLTGNVAVALGDIDGDHIDEIVLTSGYRMRIYDDFDAGFTLLAVKTHGFANSESTPTLGDYDSDGLDEIAVVYSGERAGVGLFDDAQGFFVALHYPTTLNIGLGIFGLPETSARARTGDLDADQRDELVAAWFWNSPIGPEPKGELARFDYVPGSGLVQRGVESLNVGITSGVGAPFTTMDWDMALVDSNGDGRDEIALLTPRVLIPGLTDFEVNVRRWSGSNWTYPSKHPIGSNSGVAVRASLTACDSDADGNEELYACLIDYASMELLRLTLAPSAVVVNIPQAPLAQSGTQLRPQLVAGDFDGDGFVLRHTGGRWTQVADPIPLVLLSAAPTKAGINQNYDSTSTTYSETVENGSSIGVSTSSTYSYSAGVQAAAGIFGASAKREIERSLTTSKTESSRVATVNGFTSGYDTNVIIFQGSLYESFEYEILSGGPDPALIGTFITLDNPVESRTYKWTVDKYNAEFGPRFAVGSDLLPHTVGDPQTYRSQAEVQALVAANVGWMDAGVNTIGQGSGSNSTAVLLSTEIEDTSELSYTVTDEAEFSVGFATGSYSSGLTDSEIFTVTTTETTEFAAELGDILDPDYDAWRYEFGIGVYHRGLQSGAVPVATGIPLKVVTFWTRPVGTAY